MKKNINQFNRIIEYNSYGSAEEPDFSPRLDLGDEQPLAQ